MGEGNLTEKARLFAAKMDLGAYQEAAKIKADWGLPDDMLQELSLIHISEPTRPY